MNELIELYEATFDFHNEINEYVENCCDIITALENTIFLEKEMSEEIDEEAENIQLNNAVAEKIDKILDKASNDVKAERLAKTISKTVEKVKRIESIVPVIGKAKVHIVNVWSFKKYIDNELDKFLKDGKVDNVAGKNVISATLKADKLDSLQRSMYETAKNLRIPSKIVIDKNGNVAETMAKRDSTRQGYVDALSYLAMGSLLYFTMTPVYNGLNPVHKAVAKASTKYAIKTTISSSLKPIETIKRVKSGTWGEPYETITINELYKRIKELDPEHFATIADNEIEAIRKEFARSKKMRKLGKINEDSAKRHVELAGAIVNTHADYINFKQTIVNYYIKIIDRSFSLLRKDLSKTSSTKNAKTDKA